jgi:hypothetical protein
MYAKAFSFFSRAHSSLPGPKLRAFVLVAAAVAGLAGCQPQIGDKCVLNTDCSVSGTRQCDNSMPGGYCTMFNCGPNSCPDQSACYLFSAQVDGCPYNDHVPSRTAHSFCVKDCASDGDCRTGYACTKAGDAPYNAILLDDNQGQKTVCLPIQDAVFTASGNADAAAPPAPVCEANPDIDAAFPEPPDAGPMVADAGSDADAGAGAAEDAGVDAALPDASPDATLTDAGIDATVTDAGPDGADAGPADATLD